MEHCFTFFLLFHESNVFWGQITDMLMKLNNVPCTQILVRDENGIRTCSNDALVFSQ